MGIRYYAYPLAPELVDQARADPRQILSRDPLADAWELNGTPRPDMLYLDECWRELQGLTCAAQGTPRPAYALVRGGVTDTGMGRIPWVSVLAPSEVADVAQDLSLIDDDDVDRFLDRDCGPPSASDREYLIHFLHSAQEFTARMQRRGWGLVYVPMWSDPRPQTGHERWLNTRAPRESFARGSAALVVSWRHT